MHGHTASIDHSQLVNDLVRAEGLSTLLEEASSVGLVAPSNVFAHGFHYPWEDIAILSCLGHELPCVYSLGKALELLKLEDHVFTANDLDNL